MAQISEYSEAGITVRGQYYAPGKAPKDDDRKLYLAIESTSELAVQKAGVQQWLFPFVFLIKTKFCCVWEGNSLRHLLLTGLKRKIHNAFDINDLKS